MTTTMTPPQQSKAFDPPSVETEALRVWMDEKLFHAEPGDGGKPYCVVIPPPNVTSFLHLGHAFNNTLQDVLIRWRRMAGDNAVWIPGTDHAGIATQAVVEKRVLKEEGRRRTDFSRNEFVAKIQAWKDEYEQRITDQLKRMGCSCDWDRQAFTMDEPRARAVREAFFQLFKAGLIYRGKRLVNWDPATQTALADDEVEMEEIDGFFYYLKYPVVDDEKRGEGVSLSQRGQDAHATEYMTVATTRPETMLGDTAVAINPKDPRAAALRGKFVRLPIVNRVIPIIEDDYVVMPNPDSDDPKAKYATGFLKVTPAHDVNDYEIGLRHKLPIINVFAPDAKISDQHGWTDTGEAEFLLGMDRYEAREAVVEWFRSNKMLENVKPYRHSVGHSYRSHVAIEPYLSDQWYLKVTDDRLRGAALRVLSSSTSDEAAPDRDTAREGTSRDSDATSRDREGADAPIASAAYFITFTTYGTWIHGDDRGSADRQHNISGTPYLVGDEAREKEEFENLKQPPMELDEPHRQIVLQTIQEVCRHRGWELHAAHVRPRHMHVVLIAADATPEKVMNDLKAYATRRLREAHLIDDERRVWTRHGSTRYLNDDASVAAASDYVIDHQGAPVAPGPFDGRGTNLTSRERHATSRERERADEFAPPKSAQTPLPNGRGSLQKELRFFPARYAKMYHAWLENIRDWCISRQLWWGHRIPVWARQLPADSPIEAFKQAVGVMAKFTNHPNVDVRAYGLVSGDELDFTKEEYEEPIQCFVCLRTDDDEVISEIEGRGFVRDPDVLDTWFSSGLWPMSTLGWPETTTELKTWNPTHTLCTAREIITLWVSRMVMFNEFFLDRLPYFEVFVHAMIQDGEGRKMSKSLGNGVDPLDIIESHGADAMRFTLAMMATNTQDVRMPVVRDADTGKNTSPKFDNGRNFCNKMWQVVTGFAIPNLKKNPPEPVDELKWSMADRWIVSRFNRTVEEANRHLRSYRFDQYAKACYDFFWGDLCDWYIESIKPALRDPQRAGQTANVLAAVIDGALRLLHPMTPFITEVLWWKLCEARPERGLPGRIMGCTSPRLVRAAWPRIGDFSQAAEHIWPRIQEIVGVIRNVRNEHKVDPKKPVTVSIRAGAEPSRQIEDHRVEIELLATCKLKAVGPDVSAPPTASRTSAPQTEIYIEDLVDAAAEVQRVSKRRDELARQIAQMNSRLNNEGYVAKAPAHLVQQTKDQLAKAEEELRKLD
jgi:valyl-tRNA synthetase